MVYEALGNTLTVIKGKAVTFQFIFYQNDGTTRQSITGDTLSFKVAKRYGEAEEVSTSLSITDGANGEAELALSSDNTDLIAGLYVYQLERTPSGETPKILQGNFLVRGSV